MDQNTHYVVDSETVGETFDDAADGDDVAFLAPRLAAYADTQDGTHEDDDGVASIRSGVSDEDTPDDRPAINGSEEVDDEEDVKQDEEAPVDAVAELSDNDDVSGANVVSSQDETSNVSAKHASFFNLHRAEGSDEDSELELASLLAVSRVRELLKFDGSSSIVAKSAAQAASEAVVLILRDLTRTAADQATRSKRKTVNYDDVARAAQLYDRFAYLASVLPPRETPGGKAVQVGGAGAASGGGFLHPQTTHRSAPRRERKKTQANDRTTENALRASGPIIKHPTPGEGSFKQTSLRF